jgi:Flp pilus assembly protein TadD
MNDTAPSASGPTAAITTSAADEARRLFDRAAERQRANDHDGAITLYRQLLERFPAVPDAYNNVAVMLKAQNKLPAAVACLKRALLYAPNSAALHSNLGNMLWMELAFDEAMAAFQRALALDPGRPEIYHNLGLLHYSLGQYAQAIECFERSLAIAPGAKLVEWDRTLSLLASGDLARGFAAYDVRFDLEDPTLGFDRRLRAVRSIPLPLWQGEELAGRAIWVYSEQGMGDTIQCARFLPMLAERGARIVLDCPADLARVLGTCAGVTELRPEGAPVPQADFHVPIMSLPSRLDITLANIPARVPYLSAPLAGPVLTRPPGTRAAIGLVWAGRPQHSNDRNRSMTLERLLAIADLPGVALYSLQKGARAADIAALGATALVHDLSPLIHDFADTARLLMQLDLLVTVDTAAAHLAGALGRPAYVLLPFTPDWRWMGQRDDTPWYPSLRLFRQAAPRDWDPVIARVRATLQNALAGTA